MYKKPIEELGVSETAIKALKRAGMNSVGDCIDFYIRGVDVLIPARPPFFTVIAGEVKQKLIENGYWSYVEEGTCQ